MLSRKPLKYISVLLLCILVFFPGVGLSSDYWEDQFYTYDQLTVQLQELVSQYPGLVSMSIEGQSVDNRNIRSITLGRGAKKVLITGSLHASEWITTPVLVETITEYLREYSQGRVNGESIKYILDNYSITFMPMVNPDGVTLVQEGAGAFPHRRDELLAMNPHGLDFGRWKANIRGVDLNRNYNVRWGLPITGTQFTQPSYAFYGGPYPESEPETQVVANWIRDNKPDLLLDYHSYGEVLFWYYLQTGTVLERDRAIVQAMQSHTGYRKEKIQPSVLPSSTLTYWGSAVAEIPSITVEVGGRPPHLLTMDDLPTIMNQVKYLPLLTIINLPGYIPYVPVQAVSLPGEMVAALGTSQSLTPFISPANASNINLQWASENPGIVSVDSAGVITANSLGSAKITLATDGGHQGTSQVSVYRPLPRLYGANRYATGAELSQVGWDQAGTVILARGDDFADGLAGVPLAHKLDAPLLLTRTETLSPDTREEILRLGAAEVYILGGTGAIAKSVEEEIALMGLEVVRISGDNRFDTAAQIARHLEPADTAVIAYGHNYPDALAVASYAATNGYPILLTNKDNLSTATDTALAELGIKNTIVIGGAAAIGDQVLNKLPSATRIHGPNRYATSVEIAKHFNSHHAKVFIASGLDFADAMTGAVLAARENTGILLTGKTVPKALADYIIENPQEVVLLGGPAAILPWAEAGLSQLLESSKK